MCSSEISATIMPGRNCRRMDNHRYGLRGKIINNPTDGSSPDWRGGPTACQPLLTSAPRFSSESSTAVQETMRLRFLASLLPTLAAVPEPIALNCRVCSLPAAACLPWRGVGARPQSWLLPRFSGAFLLGRRGHQPVLRRKGRAPDLNGQNPPPSSRRTAGVSFGFDP